MKFVRLVLWVVPMLALVRGVAETVKFEDAAAMLGTSCAKDIDASCRGVNLDFDPAKGLPGPQRGYDVRAVQG